MARRLPGTAEIELCAHGSGEVVGGHIDARTAHRLKAYLSAASAVILVYSTSKMFTFSEVRDGLSASPKRLDDPVFVYRDRGSELFDQVCHDPDYYIYKNEFAIIRDNASKIAELVGKNAILVDFGCGKCHKSAHLLASLDEAAAFVGLDIDADVLAEAKQEMAAKFPSVEIVTVVGNYTKKMDIPVEGRKVGLMAGSTISMYSDKMVGAIVKNCLDSLGDNGVFLVSFDSNQDPSVNSDQYMKSQYSQLMSNALTVVNDHFQADFDPTAFAYDCRWNAAEKQIEHFLVAQSPQTVAVDGHSFFFERDEPLHLYICKKWSVQEFDKLMQSVGGVMKRVFTDREKYMCLAWIEKA